MKKLQFILAKQNGKYVSTVESSIGIIANTVPSNDKKRHLQFLQNIRLKMNMKHINISCMKSKYTKMLFALEMDPRISWSQAKNFAIDFRLYTQKQKKVAQQLRKIPLGKIVSYGELADLSGIRRGARFVGNCMSSNLIPLLIPCHRVVKADRSLGNYSAGGPEVKYRLLKLEGVNLTELNQVI